MGHDSHEPPSGFKTTLYYSPEGECEAAYVALASGSAIRKAEADPRYLLTVYFGEGGVALGIGLCERVPNFVVDQAVELIAGAPPGLKRRLDDAQSTLGAFG